MGLSEILRRGKYICTLYVESMYELYKHDKFAVTRYTSWFHIVTVSLRLINYIDTRTWGWERRNKTQQIMCINIQCSIQIVTMVLHQIGV